MNALLELAARVEAAALPNKALNREVARAVGWGYKTPSEARRSNPAWFHPSDCRDGKPVIDSLHGTDVWREPMDYLASLDAAMALVPPEHTIQLSDWEADVLRAKGPWQAIVLPMGVRGKMSDFTFSNRSDHCWSPALALCAAALRARASIAGDA